MQSPDPVVRNAHRNLGSWVAYLALAVACAAAFFGVKANKDAGQVADTVKAAGPPCVDLDETKGVRLSKGCAAMVDNLNIFCARNRRYCVRSQRRAVQIAQTLAAEREIGPTTQLPEGGDRTPGTNSPRSPDRPSPTPNGDGQNDGGTQPPQQPPPAPPQQSPTTPEEPAPPNPTPPSSDVPKIIQDVEDTVCDITAPIVQVCP